jgi:hypothetical protein
MKSANFGEYLIYENGMIFSFKSNKYLKHLNYRYKCIDLYFENKKPKRFFIHRLIAENFIPNTKNKPFVNHIDGDRYNNEILNLEWVTHKENIRHCWDNGFQKKIRPVKKVICQKTNIIYESAKEAAIKLGYNHKTLCNMLNENFKHKNNTSLKYLKNI